MPSIEGNQQAEVMRLWASGNVHSSMGGVATFKWKRRRHIEMKPLRRRVHRAKWAVAHAARMRANVNLCAKLHGVRKARRLFGAKSKLALLTASGVI